MKFFLKLFIALIGAFQANAAATGNYHLYDLASLLESQLNEVDQHHDAVSHLQVIEANRDIAVEMAGSVLSEADKLSLLTRYAGMGYNLLTGNPEGSNTLGGLDPGIRTTRYIVDHTYNEGKQAFYRGALHNVPDQVEFHMSDTCTTTSSTNAYSGETSYRNELSLSAGVKGSYKGLFSVAFSLSYNMKNVEERTSKSKNVVVMQSEICNYGRAHYKLPNAQVGTPGYTLSEEFKNAVRLLPSGGPSTAIKYTNFFDSWGTHMIETVDLGRRQITRSESSYYEVYSHLLKENSGSLDFSAGYGGATIGATFDISSVQDTVDSSTEIGEEKETAIIGSVEVPLPISYTELVPITDLMVAALWGDEWASIQGKASVMVQQLSEYPANKRARINDDPLLGINPLWPDQPFLLVKSVGACPAGLAAGLFRHDVENNNNNIVGTISETILNVVSTERGLTELDIVPTTDFTTVSYCGKVTETHVGINWPRGSYCLARFGKSCPEGFYKGEIKWDDEDSGNRFAAQSPHPPYGDGKDPTIQYCCRSDGDTNNPLFLPATTAFGMYRYRGKCQKVRGMKEQEFPWYYDTEDSGTNDSSCSGNHPDDNDCYGDHLIWYCSYTPE